jgi:hypothetical protein
MNNHRKPDGCRDNRNRGQRVPNTVFFNWAIGERRRQKVAFYREKKAFVA